MKKPFLGFLGLVLVLAMSCDNASNPTSNGQADPEDITNSNPHTADENADNSLKALPKIEWDKTRHNFGKVEKGTKMMYMFKLKNVGDADLIIVDAKASCGCTVPVLPEEPIAPGESDQIQVEFSANSVGNFNKQILVTANTIPDKEPLFITGEVVEEGAN